MGRAMSGRPRLKIAVIGTGIAGMSAAWLLQQRHDITVYERAPRLGGHSNTVEVNANDRAVPVDTGFIVYNPRNYPNLTALFAHLGVPTKTSDMSFGVSLDNGDLEYSGSDLAGLFAQKRNLLRPRFLSMLRDLMRFYRDAPGASAALADPAITLGDYLRHGGYGEAFCRDHLLPMAAAIWSAPPQQMLDYPAAAFIRFHANHGLLQIADRPEWRTVDGGSKVYVEKLTAGFADRLRLDCGAVSVRRTADGVMVRDGKGHAEHFDHVVLATHADQSLALLDDADETERDVLGAFRYSRNLAVLHTDARFMPKRRAAWSSWNFIGDRDSEAGVCVTYWMNRLQSIDGAPDLFVTLNPPEPPHAGTLLHSEVYDHPMFDTGAIRAQSELWSLQGRGNTWFCGAYFGSGFHEDGLQAGLAVAEALGGVRRPWTVANESARIHLPPQGVPRIAEMA
ncbi:MAG: NAD(P)/FAD-dependent oxidoreductase [Proteobacteria bacterium]|nr:NAD(P)/FAD-dependent oxidoreductase [Pseudomonadota bacterium]